MWGSGCMWPTPMCSPAARRPERAPQVAAFLRDRPEDSLYISAVTVGGVERGIQRQRRRNRDSARGLRLRLDRTLLVFADRILDFGAEDARIRGRLSAEVRHTGADPMTAATALRHGATVITRNTGDPAPTGVALENPF